MNTASRMESTGKKNCIQISDHTANLLIKAGKANWIKLREDKIIAKGKGEMTTWFVDLSANGTKPSDTSDSVTSEVNIREGEKGSSTEDEVFTPRTKRLIDWNVEVLLRLLRQIEATRIASGKRNYGGKMLNESLLQPQAGKTVLDEVKEVISLKTHGSKTCGIDIEKVELSTSVSDQLRDYVENIGRLYRNNPVRWCRSRCDCMPHILTLHYRAFSSLS
jgi:hypothetical protein